MSFTKFILIVLGILLLTSAIITFLPPIKINQQSDVLKTFSSYDEIQKYIAGNNYGDLYGTRHGTSEIMLKAAAGESFDTSAQDYSKTNIQVEGVDEADIIKTDGLYIYTVTSGIISIIDTKTMEKITEINGSASHIYVNSNKLVVFDNDGFGGPIRCLAKGCVSNNKAIVKIYDISDKSHPKLENELVVNGSYVNSRMIDDYVYIIFSDYVHGLPEIELNSVTKTTQPSEIYYFDYPDNSYQYTNFVSINIKTGITENKVFLMGHTQNIYVSQKAVYITYMKRYSIYQYKERIFDAISAHLPSNINLKIKEAEPKQAQGILDDYLDSLGPEESAELMAKIQKDLDEVYKEIAKETEKTIVHKIEINNGIFEYKTKAEVPGNVLNQFSMDEYNEEFRIATTTGFGEEQLNHIYKLDENLNSVGKIEDMAPNERIYSARFMGDKTYLVTFRNKDPLFVIDMKEMKVLGELKIPGFSNYIHHYDETHLIGVGMDASEEGRLQGMKIALFDVSDAGNPKIIAEKEIGEAGTWSYALNDHKAFLFSRSKNLMVIPINLIEQNKWNAFQGAYVFNISLDGIETRGRISHKENEANWNAEVKRSLYIGNVLYTMSDAKLKANDLGNLEELGEIGLSNQNMPILYYE